MSVLTFKDKSGYQIKVNSPDGSIPPEQDLDRLFAMSKNKSNPDMQGGANSPALVKAKEDVAQKTAQNQGVDTQSGIVNAAANATWPVSLMMQKGLTGTTERPSIDGSGNRMLADVGGLANPLTGEFVRLGGKAMGAVGGYLDKSAAIKKGLNALTSKFTTPEGLPKSELLRKIQEKGTQAVNLLRSQKSELNKKVLNVSDKTASDIQESLPKYFRDNSEIYGTQLENISNGLVKDGNEITRGEMSTIMQDTLKESQDELLAHGKPMNEIEYLNKKYSLEPVPNESGLLDAQGKTLHSVPNPDEKLDFKEVVEDIKKLRGSLSARAKAGVKYSPEDVIAAKFMQKWGGYLETKVPELKELNQEYAPVIQTMKTAGKYFKPYSAGVDKLQGVSFLKQIADDKMQSTGKKLLDIMQNGTDRFPGIGQKTGELEDLYKSRQSVQKEIDDTIQEYADYKKSASDWLSKEKELSDKKKQVLGILAGTGMLTGGGGYAVKKLSGH